MVGGLGNLEAYGRKSCRDSYQKRIFPHLLV